MPIENEYQELINQVERLRRTGVIPASTPDWLAQYQEEMRRAREEQERRRFTVANTAAINQEAMRQLHVLQEIEDRLVESISRRVIQEVTKRLAALITQLLEAKEAAQPTPSQPKLRRHIELLEG